MAYEIRLLLTAGGADSYMEHEVEGWVIGEPDGWVQLIFKDFVTFIPASQIVSIRVPNLEEPPDDPGGS